MFLFFKLGEDLMSGFEEVKIENKSYIS